MKRFLPALVCGFAASVLSTIPGLKSFSCCLIIPAAAYFSLLLDIKINRFSASIILSKAVAFGLLTGLFASFFSTGFEVLITYITRTNEFVETLPELNNMLKVYLANPIFAQTMSLFTRIQQEITQYGFSFLYLAFYLLNTIVVDIIFGIVGALFGMHFINKKTNIE